MSLRGGGGCGGRAKGEEEEGLDRWRSSYKVLWRLATSAYPRQFIGGALVGVLVCGFGVVRC